jgi:hypothetical protein
VLFSRLRSQIGCRSKARLLLLQQQQQKQQPSLSGEPFCSLVIRFSRSLLVRQTFSRGGSCSSCCVGFMVAVPVARQKKEYDPLLPRCLTYSYLRPYNIDHSSIEVEHVVEDKMQLVGGW